MQAAENNVTIQTNISAAAHAVFTRKLSNPSQRREIRPDFPRTLSSFDIEKILTSIDQELHKLGTSLQRVERINLAYPHKHPEYYPDNYDSAKESANYIQEKLKEAAPHIKWILADGICETVHLARSENQASTHALMNHQIYEIHKPSQKEEFPFLDVENQKQEFFIIVDAAFEQGTTVANLISYIEHNGGFALAASVLEEGRNIAQKKK